VTPVLSDSAIRRLQAVGDGPDLSGTRYEAIDLVGRGGMGVVYQARDHELQRDVALKVLGTHGLTPALVDRMTREARVLAALEHPGIVPIHDVGTLPDGRVFYTMKLVRGTRLDQFLAMDRPLPERLRVLQRVCEAVGFAHARGVIHRDLKPENVMVGEFGEVLVMDWGVAKIRGIPEPAAEHSSPSHHHGELTDPGTGLGTPGYMAPEQAVSADRADERADVYALGALLALVLRGPGPRPQFPGSPRALRAVVDRAMARDPSGRYSSVNALAADIESFLSSQPVTAYRENPFERLARFSVKYRTPILLILAYLTMRLVLLFFSRR